MKTKVLAAKFTRHGGGVCEAYTAKGYTLAYLDLGAEGIHDVTLFKPHNDTIRRYINRTEVNAREIIKRHLEREGYDSEDLEWKDLLGY